MESATIEELQVFMSNGMHDPGLDRTAQGQIQTLLIDMAETEQVRLARETHAHLMALRLPPLYRDVRWIVTTVIATAAFVVAILKR